MYIYKYLKIEFFFSEPQEIDFGWSLSVILFYFYLLISEFGLESLLVLALQKKSLIGNSLFLNNFFVRFYPIIR